VRFFSNLTPDQKDIIASSLIRQKFYKGQIIIQEGDPGSTFYYIKEGSASVYKATKFQRKLAKGDSFGEQSLYYNTMRQYTIKADEDVICLVLGRDTLNRIMGDNIYEVTFKNFIRWAFEKNATISQFTKETQEKIID
jgi:CRP-like cAMP-binding protein